MYKGNEHFIMFNEELDITVSDFWRWAYSDFTNNIGRSVLAEYIVASALGVSTMTGESSREMWRPFDIMSEDGFRVEVKSAAYVQSWDCRHPDQISFKIAPASLPDPVLGYVDNAPKQRNCDAYVFCIYTATSKEQSPIDLNLWDFYVLKTSVLEENIPNQKTITLPSLTRFEPILTDYYGLKETLQRVMSND